MSRPGSCVRRRELRASNLLSPGRVYPARLSALPLRPAERTIEDRLLLRRQRLVKSLDRRLCRLQRLEPRREEMLHPIHPLEHRGLRSQLEARTKLSLLLLLGLRCALHLVPQQLLLGSQIELCFDIGAPGSSPREPIRASLLRVLPPHHHVTHHHAAHHRPTAYSRAVAARHSMLAAICAHWPGLSILKIALLGRAGEERDGNGDGRSQRDGEQCPFHGKPPSRLVSSPKSPLIATSRDRASSIGYAVSDGTIPRVAIARSELKQARQIADRRPVGRDIGVRRVGDRVPQMVAASRR